MSRRTQRLKFTSGFRALRKRKDVRLQATVRSTSHNVVVIETECHEIRLDGLPKNHARCAAETAALRDFVPTYDRCGSSATDRYASGGRAMPALPPKADK
jgi:hypothetical protein